MNNFQDVLNYQERLIKNYKYRPLPDLVRDEARALYERSLPEGFSLDGGDRAVFSPSGLKIAERYNRIVIGDYGAMVEILPDDVVHENICVKKGQEYRDQDPRYAGKVKFSWLTARDDTDIKISYQKKEVGYADYVPGRYYVSVYECAPSKLIGLDGVEDGKAGPAKGDIEEWLKEYGVYSEDLAEYYLDLVPQYGFALGYALEYNAQPYEFEFWRCICDVCQVPEGLSFEQLEAIAYNLNTIGCVGTELKGTLESLAPDVRVAFELGLEGLAFPYEFQNFSTGTIRELLRASAEDLLCVSRFAKVMAGHKSEMCGLDSVLNYAKERCGNDSVHKREQDYVMG